MYTQCLVVSQDTLARFANNPFALMRAALASGSLKTHDRVPSRLEPFRLAGRAKPVDSSLLARLASNPGSEWMATLVQVALRSATIAVSGGPPAEHVIAGLINCFPRECRTELPFSTGLKFSPRRPFRLVALSKNAEERRRVERLYNLVVLDLDNDLPAEFSPIDAWPRLLHRVLKSGRTTFLNTRLSNGHADFLPEDLNALGLQFLEELEETSRPPDPIARDVAPRKPARPSESQANREDQATSRSTPPDEPAKPQTTPSGSLVQAHTGHQRFEHQKRASSLPIDKEGRPSADLDPDDPEVLEKLEHLDDLVYDAIQGKSPAMDELATFWPTIRKELGDRLLAESREQYLRYAMAIWEEATDPAAPRQPSRAVRALDVLCILFDAV
jgi:hypothetical protein